MDKRGFEKTTPRRWSGACWKILPILAFIALMMILSNGTIAKPSELAIHGDNIGAVDLDGTSEATGVFESVGVAKFLNPPTLTEYDSDGNGIINNLIIGIDIETYTPGYYSFNCELLDSTGVGIISIYNGSNIDGALSTDFNFQGIYISQGMSIDGEFTVSLSLSDSDGLLVDQLNFQTREFERSQFEFITINEDRTISTLDMNGNGLYDSLDVNFHVETSLQDLTYVSAFLSCDYNSMAYSSSSYQLTTGMNNIAVSFPSQQIYSSGMDGEYEVYLVLESNPYAWHYYKWLTLDTYAAGSFDHSCFVLPFTESTLDEDGDGFYEYLIVNVPVSITQDDSFVIEGQLTNSDGTRVGGCWYSAYLTTGTYTIEARFNTYLIEYFGVDGPYDLTLKLENTDWSNPATLLDTASYQTAAYSANLFESPAVLAPPHSDQGMDTDGNGYFEVIEVSVNFEVSYAGYYSIWGDIVDGEGNIITSGFAQVELSAGPQNVALWFNTLFLYGIAGPYDVRLTIQDLWGGITDIGMYHTTTYASEQFDHVCVTSIADHRVDIDGNGLFDHLALDIVIDSTQTGTCYLSTSLICYTPSGSFSLGHSDEIDLALGPNPYQIQFLTLLIGNSGIDGPYQIQLSMSSVLGGDTLEYWTIPYASVEFDHAYVVPPLSDHGIDKDGDGLFEYLSIDITLDVSFAGWYNLVTYVYDSVGNNINQNPQSIFLSSGQQTVNILISGNSIINKNAHGPYTLINFLSRDSFFIEYGQVTSINTYSPEDFEKNVWFLPPSSIIGSDQDLDGLYEDLIIRETIEVQNAGWYRVVGYLTNGWSDNMIDGKVVFLESDQYSVALKLSGALLLRDGREGPFDIRVKLYDLDWNLLDSDYRLVSEYTLAQFEPLAKFLPPHVEKGLDVDGDGKFEYLKVVAKVDISVPGQYCFRVNLLDGNGQLLETSYTWVDLKAHVRTVTVLIPANNIVSTAVNGPYMISISLSDASLHPNYEITTDQFQTRDYRITQFEAGTELADVISDEAIDTDGDGLYDVLQVEVQIYVDKKDVFSLNGELFDNEGTTLLSFNTVKQKLVHGMNTVTLRFDGMDIWSKGLDGPYQVELRLFSSNGQQLDEFNYYAEGQYLASSFDPPTFKIIINEGGKINLRSTGNLEVVIYGSKQVDVRKIDPSTFRIGHDGLWISAWKWEYVDVNKDGKKDLLFKFHMSDVRPVIEAGMTSLGLRFLYDCQNLEVNCKIEVRG